MPSDFPRSLHMYLSFNPPNLNTHTHITHIYHTQEPCHDPMFNIGPKKSIRVNNVAITTDEWEIPPSHVIIEDCLGEGAFGEVYRGIIRGPIVNPKVHPSMKSAICTAVAIKLLKCKLIRTVSTEC